MKRILFFSRSGYTKLFPKLASPNYKSFHVCVNILEKERLEESGVKVTACLEEMYPSLPIIDFPPDYLMKGFYPDRFLGWMNMEERKEFLGKTISFWRHLIEKYQIDACVHETISYEPEEVLSLVAREMGVLDFTFVQSCVNGYFFWKPNPYNTSFPKELLEQASPSQKITQVAGNSVQEIINKGLNPKYLSFKDLQYKPKSKRQLLKEVWNYERGHYFKRAYVPTHEEKKRSSQFYFNHYNQNPNTFYENIMDQLSIQGENYDNLEDYAAYNKLFFPVHLVPEATLLYFSPKYSNQLIVIEEIARYLPMNWVLVVKEHPSQPGFLLTQSYARLRRLYSNVIYLKADISAHYLIQQSQAIFTITGTVGWEALVQQKAVFLLGNVFYDKHPSVMKLEDISEMQRYISRGFLSPSSMDISKDYLARVLDLAYRGSLVPAEWDKTGNIEKIKTSILEIFDKPYVDIFKKTIERH